MKIIIRLVRCEDPVIVVLSIAGQLSLNSYALLASLHVFRGCIYSKANDKCNIVTNNDYSLLNCAELVGSE